MVSSGRQVLAKRRCLYLGSATPLNTAYGLDALQRPLADKLPLNMDELQGYDAWVSVDHGGVGVTMTDGQQSYHNIRGLHVCAALRRIFINGAQGTRVSRFVALDSPAAQSHTASPPVFAAVLQGDSRQLECHVFVCKSDASALSLVHAATYAFQNRSSPGFSTSSRRQHDKLFKPPYPPEPEKDYDDGRVTFMTKTSRSRSMPRPCTSPNRGSSTMHNNGYHKNDPRSFNLAPGPPLPLLPGKMYKGPHFPLIVVPPPPPGAYLPLTRRGSAGSSRSSSSEREQMSPTWQEGDRLSRREVYDIIRKTTSSPKAASGQRPRSAEMVRSFNTVPVYEQYIVSPAAYTYRYPSPDPDDGQADDEVEKEEEEEEEETEETKGARSGFVLRENIRNGHKVWRDVYKTYSNAKAFGESLHAEKKSSSKLAMPAEDATSAYSLLERGETREEGIANFAADLFAEPDRSSHSTGEGLHVQTLEKDLGYLP